MRSVASEEATLSLLLHWRSSLTCKWFSLSFVFLPTFLCSIAPPTFIHVSGPESRNAFFLLHDLLCFFTIFDANECVCDPQEEMIQLRKSRTLISRPYLKEQSAYYSLERKRGKKSSFFLSGPKYARRKTITGSLHTRAILWENESIFFGALEIGPICLDAFVRREKSSYVC